MQQLLRSGAIQASLHVSQPGDPAEVEAERMAGLVTGQTAAAPVASQCSCSGSGQPCEECRQSAVHRAASSAVGGHTVTPRTASHSAAHAVQHALFGSSGHPLDAASRAFFEPRFGRDFSSVRIHTGPPAAESTRAINARAYTHGSDIVFDQGEYQPSSQAGRHLLAHELTHILQQSAAPSSTLYRDADTTPPTLEEEAKALIKRYFVQMTRIDDFSGIVHELDFALLALRYDFLLQVFDAIDSSLEDNVGAELISITPPSRLSLYASSALGRRMLNVIYEAIITGDVTDFERAQADKILNATKISQASYISQAEQRLIVFAVRNQGFTRDCYATFNATLESSGKVKVWYTSERIWQCSMFKEDIATFPDHHYTSPREFDPDTLVAVHLYDQGGAIIPVPAIALIDYANQSNNATLSLAKTAFVTGLTVGAFGLGGVSTGEARVGLLAAQEAGEGIWAARLTVLGLRAIQLADAATTILPIITSMVEENRDWIVENVPGGEEIVEGIEKANAIAAYYGYARLGVAGLRFMKSQLSSVLKARAAGIPPGFNAEQKALLQKIDTDSQSLFNTVEENEKVLVDTDEATRQAASEKAAPPVSAGTSAAGTSPPTASAPHATPAPVHTPAPAPVHSPAAPPPAHAAPPETAPLPHTPPAPAPPAHAAPAQPAPHAAPHTEPPAHTEPHTQTAVPSSHAAAEPVSEPTRADPQSTARPGDFTHTQIEEAGQKLEQRIADPKNVRAAKSGSGYDLEVDLGDGQVFKRRPDGTWCLSRNPVYCGLTAGPKVESLTRDALRRLRSAESIEAAVELAERNSGRTFSEAEKELLRARLRENPALAVDILDQAAKVQTVIEPPGQGPEPDTAHPTETGAPSAADQEAANTQSGRGGSAPGEAGKLGKDLSRSRAMQAGDTWICEEPQFRFTRPDGGPGEFYSDVGMTGASEGGPYLIESKLGPDARLTDNQIPGYQALRDGRAYPINDASMAMARRASPNWKPGDPMPSLPVRLEYWRWVKQSKYWKVTVSHW